MSTEKSNHGIKIIRRKIAEHHHVQPVEANPEFNNLSFVHTHTSGCDCNGKMDYHNHGDYVTLRCRGCLINLEIIVGAKSSKGNSKNLVGTCNIISLYKKENGDSLKGYAMKGKGKPSDGITFTLEVITR